MRSRSSRGCTDLVTAALGERGIRALSIQPSTKAARWALEELRLEAHARATGVAINWRDMSLRFLNGSTIEVRVCDDRIRGLSCDVLFDDAPAEKRRELVKPLLDMGAREV